MKKEELNKYFGKEVEITFIDDHILTGLFYVNDRRKYKLIVDEFNTYVFYPSLVKGIKAL